MTRTDKDVIGLPPNCHRKYWTAIFSTIHTQAVNIKGHWITTCQTQITHLKSKCYLSKNSENLKSNSKCPNISFRIQALCVRMLFTMIFRVIGWLTLYLSNYVQSLNCLGNFVHSVLHSNNPATYVLALDMEKLYVFLSSAYTVLFMLEFRICSAIWDSKIIALATYKHTGWPSWSLISNHPKLTLLYWHTHTSFISGHWDHTSRRHMSNLILSKEQQPCKQPTPGQRTAASCGLLLSKEQQLCEWSVPPIWGAAIMWADCPCPRISSHTSSPPMTEEWQPCADRPI